MPCLWMPGITGGLHGITRGCWSLRILSDSCRGVLPRLLPAGRDTRLPRMADILTPKQRSALMACIRSAGNASTELRLVALLRAAGITGWRRGQRLPLRGQATDDGRQRTEDRGRITDYRGRTAGDGGPRTGDGRGEGQTAGRRLKRRATVGHPCSSAKSVVGACRPSSAVGHPPSSIRHRPLLVRPDFVFRKQRLVVFVDGCFWHGCPAHYTRPKARRVFWDAKIAANRARDRRINRALRAAGWRVLHVWEHGLKARQLGRTLARLRRAVDSERLPVAGRQ